LTKWKPDTCDCIVEFDNNQVLERIFQKCQLHKDIPTKDLLETLLTHNRGFNLKHGVIDVKLAINKSFVDEIIQDKKNELSRVKAMGKPIKL